MHHRCCKIISSALQNREFFYRESTFVRSFAGGWGYMDSFNNVA